MSHEIYKPIDTVYTNKNSAFSGTWHDLHQHPEGEKIELDGSNIKRVLRPLRSFGFKPVIPEGEAISQEDFCYDSDSDEANSIANRQLICADLRENEDFGKIIPVHVPTSSYSIHQNQLLFDTMIGAAREVVGDDSFEIATVGTLGKYSHFFVSLAIKGQDTFDLGKIQIGPAKEQEKDSWGRFFNLISSHNGQISSAFMASMIRIVCMNTVKFSLRDSENAGTQEKIKHSKESESRITSQVFEAKLKEWIGFSEEYTAFLKAIRNESCDVETAKAFATGLLVPVDPPKGKVISTTVSNRAEEISALFARGTGNIGKTRYDLYNGITEFYTSGDGVSKSKKTSEASKLAKSEFGTAAEMKREATVAMMDSTVFEKTVKRGEILLDAYAKKGVEIADVALN